MKTYFLDYGESWATGKAFNLDRIVLFYKRLDICKFYVKLFNFKRYGHVTVTIYRPYTCLTSTYLGFKKRNAGWYIKNKFEKDISKNKKLIVKDIQGRAEVYYNMPNVGFMLIYRGRELVREKLDRNEKESF